MTITQQLDYTRNNPAFASMTAKDQYDQQRQIILQGLSAKPEFLALPDEQKLEVFRDSISKGVEYVYEDQGMADFVNTMTARILGGDQEAMQAAQGYVLGSYTNENLPLLSRMAMKATTFLGDITGEGGTERWSSLSMGDRARAMFGGQGPEGGRGDVVWGVPGEYFRSGFNTTKTKGADDNKARAELTGMLRSLDPDFDQRYQEETGLLDKSRLPLQIMEGVTVGAFTGTGAAALFPKAAAVAAPATGTAGGALRSAGQAVLRRAPAIAAEAVGEGIYGILEGLSDAGQSGETFTGGDAGKNFALYAGGDLLFNGLLQTFGPLVKYGLSPWSRKVKKAMGGRVRYNEQEIFNMLDELKRGEVPLELTELTNQPELADHLQTVKKYWELDAKIKHPQDVEMLSEMDRALYDSFELGYDMIPLENGRIRVRPNGDIQKGWEFDDLYDAKEWIGSRIKLEDLEKMDLSPEARALFYSQKRHILNHGIMTESLDRHATQFGGVPEGANKGFSAAGTRQLITPAEADGMQGGFTPGRIFRFDMDVPTNQKKKVFTGNEDLVFEGASANPKGKVLVHAHSPASPQDYQKALTYAEEIRVREGLDVPAEKIARNQLIEAGHDGAIDANGNLHYFFPDRVKVVSDYIDPMSGKVGQSAYAKTLKQQARTSPAVEMVASGKVTAKARRLGNSPAAFGRVANSTLTGELNEESVEGLVRAYAGRMGGSGLKGSYKIRLNPDADSVKFYKEGNSLAVELPSKIENPQQARKIFNELTNGLEKQYPVRGAKSRKAYAEAFRKSQREFMLPMANPAVREGWVKGLAEMNGTPIAKNGGWYTVQLSDGTTIKSRSIDDVARNLILDNVDPQLLKYDMMSQGFKLEDLGDGTFRLSTLEGTELAEGTFKDVADVAGYSPSKLPASLSPKVVVENKVPGISMEIDQQQVSGSKEKVDEFMSIFEDFNDLLQSSGADVKKSGEIMIRHSKMNYEVRVPQINYTESFESMADARKFFNGGWKDLDNLHKITLKKGGRLEYKAGKWHVTTPGQQSYIGSNSEELYDALHKMPTPTYEKNVVPEDLDNYLNSIGKRVNLLPGDETLAMDAVDAIPKYDIGTTAQHTKGVFDDLRPAIKVIREHFHKAGDKAGAKMFEDLMNGIDAWNADARPYDEVLNKIFRDENGKLISLERRQGISAVLEAKSPELEAKAFAEPEFKLEESDHGRIAQMREFWNTLGQKAQFDQKMFLQNYVPNVRSKVNKDLSMEQIQPMSRDYLKGTFENGQGVPKELRMVYRLERTADMARVMRNTDAMDLALTYNKMIHRDLYLNKPWQELYGHMNKVIKDGKGNAALLQQLNELRERIVSPQMSQNQRAIDDAMKKFMTKVGLPKDTQGDVADWFTKWHYRTAMSYRPWLPFRNLWQTHVILPLKTGSLRPINRAMRTFTKNPAEVVDEMLRRGLATESDSLVESLRQFHKTKSGRPDNAIDKFFDFGMSPFGRSDLITRGVAWLSSKDLLGQGVAAMGKTGDMASFIRKSRLEVFHPNIQQQVVGYMQKGMQEAASSGVDLVETVGYQAAENMYGRAMIRATMFDYRMINRPIAQKGFIGKIGLQYGTHPINAWETIKEAASYGSLGARAKGAIAAGGASLALAGAFKALGISNSNFLLWKQPLFSGGPGFKLLTQVPLLMDSSYRGDQARRDFSRTFLPVSWDKQSQTLSGQWPQMLPGFYQAYYWNEGAKYLDQGKLWESWLSFMTVPIDKDRRNLIYEETGGQAGG